MDVGGFFGKDAWARKREKAPGEHGTSLSGLVDLLQVLIVGAAYLVRRGDGPVWLDT